MSISSISGSSGTVGTSATQADTQKTLQQLAQEGDPIAIAELKNEKPQEQPAQTGAFEPGKGETIDTYV